MSTLAGGLLGGYSDHYIVNDEAPIPAYDSIIFTPFQNALGSHLDSQTILEANSHISKELQNRGVRTTGDAPLYLDGYFIHADDSTLSKDLVARVRIIDPKTWQVLREANVVGKVEGLSSMNAAARAIGDGVVKLLDKTQMSRNVR